ncbi:MAG: hypothetical protein P1V81_08450 [Planctomycetota bacterium]|nr:hypothetical protein [Planctomycetota bacterium]
MRRPTSCARRGRSVAIGLVLVAGSLACSGDSAYPPTVLVTPTGVFDEGGGNHAPPAPPTLLNGRRVWGLTRVEAADGEHLFFDMLCDRDDAGGNFDVLHRLPDGLTRSLHSESRHEGLFEANISAAAGPDGRLFAAWELGSADWGHGEALREARSIAMATTRGAANWFRVPLPAMEVLAAPDLALDARFGGLPTAPDGRAVEAPRLVVDAGGIPWLFFRYLTRWMPLDHARQSDGAGGSNRRAAWRIRAMALTDAGWTEPIELPRSDGPADGGLELEPLPGGGVVARWYTDRRLEGLAKALAWEDALPQKGGWLSAELRLEGPADPPTDLEPEERRIDTLAVTLEPDTAPEGPAYRDSLPAGGQLLFADLHRHTDGSRCKIEEDGTLLDQYRYAVEVGGLDVLAVTNHFQHATDATWQRERDAADGFDGLALDPSPFAWNPASEQLERHHRSFVALYGYERALPIGHWTMVASLVEEGADPASLDEAPFVPFRPRFLWDEHDPATWLAMPHQIADSAAPLDWRTDSDRAPVHGSAFEPLAELYQSRRGSYEVRGGWLEDLGVAEQAPRLMDFLNQGRRFGFGASSDHTTTSRAYTGIRLLPGEAPSRATVIAALRARRTFAATARLDLDVRLDGYPMGSVVPASGDPQLAFEVDLQGTGDRLAQVELVKNGVVVQRASELTIENGVHRKGRLTLRLGRSVQDQVTTLTSKDSLLTPETPGAAFGEVTGLGLEADDALEVSELALELRSVLDTRDEDGLTAEVTWEAGARIELAFDHPKQRTERSEDLDELAAAGSTGVFRVRGGRAELRLDPPAAGYLGRERTTWAPGPLVPGDWLYLRLVTTSGEAAWTSPFFVE